MQNTEQINEKFFEEYVSDDAVRKYSTQTAGFGVNYLLHHDYGEIYLGIVDAYLRTSPQRPLRLLEFGCGAGMNITTLVSLLQQKGFPVERAYGTDFSPRLVETAGQQARATLNGELAKRLTFHVARNEKLTEDLAAATGKRVDDFVGFFDLIIGVNTFRYCHRLGKSLDCAADIYRMLRAGGVCVNIDMNNKFPAFRSKLRHSVENPAESYLPTLHEYASPFQAAGFDLIQKKNFCWIPHSAGRALTLGCRIAAPFLNLVARNKAMRSLVVARKPG